MTWCWRYVDCPNVERCRGEADKRGISGWHESAWSAEVGEVWGWRSMMGEDCNVYTVAQSRDTAAQHHIRDRSCVIASLG